MPESGLQRYLRRLQASEISRFSRYCDKLIQFKPLEHDSGSLRQLLAGEKGVIVESEKELEGKINPEERAAILINGNFNHCDNIQGMLSDIKLGLNRRSRLLVVTYNPYLNWLVRLLTLIGLRKGGQPQTFIKRVDLDAIVALSGYEIVRCRYVGYVPRLLGLGHLVNKVMPTIPLFRWLCISNVFVLRPVIPDTEKTSLSVVIPARNESGNIENALKRIPEIPGIKPEIIYVEGNSTDDTWDEIQRVLPLYKDKFQLKAYQQTGKGKNDAVRLGFSHATGDILTILDADLTMPPERLDKFYYAYVEGKADYINGSRLVYQMEKEAMRPLNVLGNIFFAKALSWTLEQRYGDALCGTKMIHRLDYDKIKEWRNDFGDFDPFGDFDLLFPVADIGIGSIDLPIRYRARSYGDTNISRFSHGFVLLKMTLIGLIKIKLSFFRK